MDRDSTVAHGAEILRAEVSQPRRWLAVGMLGTLGVMLTWTALATAPAPGWRLLLAAAGLGAGWVALRLHAATRRPLVLREGALVEDGAEGRVLARLQDVAGVDRGALAFKPSNGFLLHLRPGAQGLGGVWAPGLWWRVGRRVGVGGVLRQAPARAVAEAIALSVAGRTDR